MNEEERREIPHPDLCDKEGSISHALESNKVEIERLYNANNLANMKEFVRNVVVSINDKPLDKKSVATKRFLNALNQQRNCLGVLQLVWNTIMKGDNLGVIR